MKKLLKSHNDYKYPYWLGKWRVTQWNPKIKVKF